MKKPGCVIAGVILIFLIIITSFTIETYNKLVRLDENVKEQWSQIETQYQRRMDLIPSMVEVTKRYATHESQIFIEVANARSKFVSAKTIDEKMEAAKDVGVVMGRLFGYVENYPNLKANETFIRLMDQWEGTENIISVQRMRYNEIVKKYNYTAKSFLGRFWVSIFGFDKEKPYFEAAKGAEVAPSAKDIWDK